jgi:hypothetical protein
MKKLLLASYTLFFIGTSFSQNTSPHSLMYTSFDKAVGTLNTKLSYGVLFEEKYRKVTKNNHNFFLSDMFQKGNVQFRDEVFFDIEIKYDITNDILITRITNEQQKLSIILEKKLVERFKMNEFNFVNTFPQEYGYLEEVATFDNFSILKKHRKTVERNTDKSFVHHTFKKAISQYYLFYKKKFFPIESKKDFFKIFPKQKKLIHTYFNKNSSMRKHNYKTFVSKLMKQLEIKK